MSKTVANTSASHRQPGITKKPRRIQPQPNNYWEEEGPDESAGCQNRFRAVNTCGLLVTRWPSGTIIRTEDQSHGCGDRRAPPPVLKSWTSVKDTFQVGTSLSGNICVYFLFSRRFRIKVAGDFSRGPARPPGPDWKNDPSATEEDITERCIHKHGNITEKEQQGKYLKIKMWEVKASVMMGALWPLD